jgi:hypothetical protein
MKSLRTLITTCLLFTSVSLFAQIENRPLMTVNIPFNFSVDGHALPAGEYTVLAVTPVKNIALVSTDRKHSLIVSDLPNYASNPSVSSRLVFNRYGNQYFLAQVWTAGQEVARNPFASNQEKEMARAGGRPQTEIVLAFAKR